MEPDRNLQLAIVLPYMSIAQMILLGLRALDKRSI